VAFVDGGDRVDLFPYGPTWWRKGAGFSPRPHRRVTTFKREWSPRTSWLRFYCVVPSRLADGLPWGRRIRPIGFSIPDDCVLDCVPIKDQRFPRHIVDDQLRHELGIAPSKYTFSSETDYFSDLQRARFGITTRRAGWDTLRHLEVAANGCVVCFRNLDSKPARCAPHGLDASNSISYTDTVDLFAQLDSLSPDRERRLQRAALDWAALNTTVRRAREVLANLGLPVDEYGGGRPGPSAAA
jgi:hypothetical protein